MEDIKQFKCVIFDMDGTLLYTTEDITKSLNLTLSFFGYPLHTEKEVESYLNNGAYKLVERALPQDARDNETVSKVLKKYLEIYNQHVCEKTCPYDGIYELVKKLKESGIKIAVVSNKPDAQTKKLAVHCFGEGTFDYISGSGEGLPIKPDKECVFRATQSMGVDDMSEVLFVGDSCVDVLTAKNTGIKSAGVLWGFSGKASFSEHKPDYYIDTAKTLEKIIL